MDLGHHPIRLANVLFVVRAFANRKNDFVLGPFATDQDGVVKITKRDLMAEATANYDTGIMDFDSVENCKPVVEIAAMKASEIEKALQARTTIWTKLLVSRF